MKPSDMQEFFVDSMGVTGGVTGQTATHRIPYKARIESVLLAFCCTDRIEHVAVLHANVCSLGFGPGQYDKPLVIAHADFEFEAGTLWAGFSDEIEVQPKMIVPAGTVLWRHLTTHADCNWQHTLVVRYSAV